MTKTIKTGTFNKDSRALLKIKQRCSNTLQS
jgi:hypothetical protein